MFHPGTDRCETDSDKLLLQALDIPLANNSESDDLEIATNRDFELISLDSEYCKTSDLQQNLSKCLWLSN